MSKPQRLPQDANNSDRHIFAVWSHAKGEYGNGDERVSSLPIDLIDSKQTGLTIRLGVNRATWAYKAYGHDDKGKTTRIYEKLGEFRLDPRNGDPLPGHMGTQEARQAAAIWHGDVQKSASKPGDARITFAEAFADYVEYLRRKVARANVERAKKGQPEKPARWAGEVERIGKTLLLPQWKDWTLTDMSDTPRAVRVWHAKISDSNGRQIADKCAAIITATYKKAAEENRKLPGVEPCSSVELNGREMHDRGMPFKDFPKWLAAWKKITVEPSQFAPQWRRNMIAKAKREYALFCLLTGARPGEAARIRWCDVKPSERVIEVPAAKAGNTIRIVMSAAIARVLKRARDIESPTDANALVFPFCAQVASRLPLPYSGHSLRHTYRTVAADVGIDGIVAHVLLGHAPRNVSEQYISQLVLASGVGLRGSQRKVSARVIELLKADPTLESKQSKEVKQKRVA